MRFRKSRAGPRRGGKKARYHAKKARYHARKAKKAIRPWRVGLRM